MLTTNQTSELNEVLAGAMQISRENHLKEVCSEALLLAILASDTAEERLLKISFNVFLYKKVLEKRLAAKASDTAPDEPPRSLAVDGLLILNAWEDNATGTALHLLTTIVKNHNTAAARLLRKECVYLNEFNQLIYKTL
jgi:ATP-dependent Clp protease ATP-binding subunit ClpA